MTLIAKARASWAAQLAAVIPRELGYAAEPGMVVAVGLRPTGRCLWFGAADLVDDPPGDIAADLADLARRSGASDVVLLGYGAPAEAGFADALRLARELAPLLPDVEVTEAGVADDVVYARDDTGAGAHRAFTLVEALPGTRSQTRTAHQPTTPADHPAAPVEGEGPQIAAALDRLEALTGEDDTGHRGSVRATLAGLLADRAVREAVVTFTLCVQDPAPLVATLVDVYRHAPRQHRAAAADAAALAMALTGAPTPALRAVLDHAGDRVLVDQLERALAYGVDLEQVAAQVRRSGSEPTRDLADLTPVPYTLVDPGAGRADLGAGL